MDEQISKLKTVRWEAWLLQDKNPYVCYRIVLDLEKLMPKKYSQIKEIMWIDKMEPTANEIIIETDPEKVFERYITSVMSDSSISAFEFADMSKIRKLVGEYIYYLKSNQQDRLLMWRDDQKFWERYI